jgi:hypothetical protein
MRPPLLARAAHGEYRGREQGEPTERRERACRLAPRRTRRDEAKRVPIRRQCPWSSGPGQPSTRRACGGACAERPGSPPPPAPRPRRSPACEVAGPRSVVSSRCRASAPTPKRKHPLSRAARRPSRGRRSGMRCGGFGGGRVMLMGGILGVARHLSPRAPRPGASKRPTSGNRSATATAIPTRSRRTAAKVTRRRAPESLRRISSPGERCGLRKRRRWR